eukprot:TRINITY_DN878_c0_g1_i1.p1 TRINITY_DN878_c0_g1~~TRINITY_DN878_c0_g1_i1.p1  ORF type:complete len:2064 (+),score=290.39 TRINITY_DN878_c0_g1_i1:8288-14479(+)
MYTQEQMCINQSQIMSAILKLTPYIAISTQIIQNMMNFDEQPVGQHNKLDIPELPPEAPTESSTLPLRERLTSKNPKIRFEAACDLLKEFSEATESAAFTEHYPALAKLLSDTHPGAQEKALESLLVLLDKSPPAITDKEIISVIIEKCLTSGKTNTKSKAVECLLAMSELAEFQVAVYEITKGYISTKSTPLKIMAATLGLLTQLVANFGSAVFPVKEVLTQVVTQAGSTNTMIKNEAMGYLREAHKWVKDGVLKAIGSLKPAQQEELKKAFAEDVEPPVAKRVVKGGTVKSKPMEDISYGKTNSPGKKKDGYVIAQETPVLGRFNEKWCNNLMKLKKWSEKRDKLEELIAAISVERIKSENFFELGSTLKKLLNDPNIIVVNLAIRTIGQLSKGLRGHFATYARHIFTPILQKCKDKKTAAESQKCLENLVLSLKLEDTLEDIKEALSDKSPQIKIRICTWLATVGLPNASSTDLLSIWVKELVPILVKLTDDAAGEVRDSALGCIGAFKSFSNDSGLESAIKEMNTQKQQKILKAAEENKVEEKDLMKPEPMRIEEETKSTEEPKEEVSFKKPASELIVIEAGPPHVSPKRKPVLAAKPKAKKEVIVKPKEVKIEDVGTVISKEEAEKVVLEKIPIEITKDFEAAEWKERQKRLQELNAWVLNNLSSDPDLAEALAVWLKSKLKDFKESNINIVKEAFALIQTITSTIEVTKKFASIVVPGLIEKLGDTKLLDTCQTLLLSISDSATPTYVASVSAQTAYCFKSVNAIKGTLVLFSKMTEEYTAKLVPVNVVLDYAKYCLGHANIQVRNLATKVIVAVYSQLGDSVKPLISADLKDTLYKSIEAELAKAKVQHNKAEIKRKLKGEAEAEAESKKKVKDAVDALIPRTNISAQVTSKLISGLADPSMKVRQDAKDTLEKILASANNRILPNGLNALMGALKGRMNEPCKNLAKGFITLVGNLAAAMGQASRQYSKIILQPLMWNLADKQTTIRTETLLAANKFAEAAGPEIVLNNLGPVLEKDNPELRKEVLGLILKYKEHLGKSDTNSLVSPLVAAMQDRSKEIRVLTEEVTGEVMQYVGYQAFMGAIQDLKPILKSSLQAVLEKYKLVDQKPDEHMADCSTNKAVEAEEPVEKMEDVGKNKAEEEKSVQESKPMEDVGKVKDNDLPAKTNARKGTTVIIQRKVAPLPPKIPNHAKKDLSKTQIFPTTHMTTSRSTNDLVNKTSSKFGKTLRGLKGGGLKQSPSKSQLSASSAIGTVGTLIVETVIMNTIGNKEKRAEADKNARWPVNEVRADYVEKLKKALRPAIHPSVFDYMFAAEFKKNLEAVKLFTETIKSDFASLVDIMDLVFKWFTMKMVDQTNTVMNRAIIEFLTLFFAELYQSHYTLQEFEAAAIIPIMCERLGVMNTGLREEYKTIIKKACEIYSVSKICGYLVAALDSKNPKARSECLVMLRELVKAHGVKVLTVREIKAVSKILGTGDTAAKGEAVEFLTEVYRQRGDKVWSMVGEITEKNKEALKQKFGQVETASSVMLPDDAKEEEIKEDSRLVTNENGLLKSMQKITLANPSNEISQKPEATPKITPDSPMADIESMQSMGPSIFTDKMILDDGNSKEEDKSVTIEKSSAKTPRENSTKELLLDTVDQCLEVLKEGDIPKKVDALISLNEKITNLLDKNKDTLIASSGNLFTTFTAVLKEIFDKPPHDIPIRFAKYFLNVFSKICSMKFLVRELNEQTMFVTMEHLLAKLLYEELDKMGNNAEGECMIKALNMAIIRIMENSDPTKAFIVLLGIFRKYKDLQSASGSDSLAKLPGLTIKCILKLCKVLESLIPFLDVPKLLLTMHDYLLENPSSPQPRSQNDEIGIRVIKTIVNELVKFKKEHIWEDYNKAIENSSKPDLHLKRWINIILKSLSATVPEPPQPDELREIFKGLNSQTTFKEAIKSLSEYIQKHPHTDLNQYFASCSHAFSQLVLSSLNEYMASSKVPIEQKPGTSLAEYREKMKFLKQKLGILQSEEKPATEGATSENANTKAADILAKINQYKAMVRGSPRNGIGNVKKEQLNNQ